MYGGKTIGVVVPAYNEEEQVAEVIETIPSYVDRVYAVDDASTDDTWEEITGTSNRLNERGTPSAIEDGGAASGRRVVPLQHEENRGVGGAIKTGYLAALEDRIDVVAIMAGDGQMDPALLESIVDPVTGGRADYAKGNRLAFRETRLGVPRFRLFGNLLLSFLTKVASGYWPIGDSQNGYTAISRRALERVDVEEMYEFYGYCNDLLVRLNAADMVVVDVPAPIIYGEETSNIDYTSYVPLVSAMLLRTFLWRLKEKYVLKDFHPLVLLYGVGAFGASTALVQALGAGKSERSRTVLASEAVTSAQLAALAFVLAMLQDREYNEHLAERADERRREPSEEAPSR